nr:hypothetical protein [Tanacetum cinerariifolium]
MYRIDNRTTQTRASQSHQTVRNTNPRVSTSIGVNHKINVSRPHYRRNQMKDKVLPNNSQVKPKKTQVEEHPRISSISNKTKSVTACKDSLNSRTSNVNVVCATCGKCLVDFNHFACVTKMLIDVNARTKKPNVVPIITRNPKGHANKSVAFKMLLRQFLVMEIWFKEISRLTGFITSKASITISSMLVNFVMWIWRLLSGNLLVLLEIFRDETPEVLKEFLTMIQRNLQALVITVRTEKGTEFLNKTLNAFFKLEGIKHQTSTAQTPEQNGVVKRRNRTLVEAAQTMLSALRLPLFFWAEAIATVCYTQNRSIIIPTHDKTAYHIINDRKPSIKHLHIFGWICYITKDGENLDKLKEKGDL